MYCRVSWLLCGVLFANTSLLAQVNLLHGLGAVGDSLTDEYQFQTRGMPPGNARCWLEQLAVSRSLNFGDFTTIPRPPPRNQGYEFNWALAAGNGGATTSDLLVQASGLASQVTEGKVTLAYLGMGANDLYARYFDIHDGLLTGPELDQFLGLVAGRIESATDTILSAGEVRMVVETVFDLGTLPHVRSRTTPAGRARAREATENLNCRILEMAFQRNLPVMDCVWVGDLVLRDSMTIGGVAIRPDGVGDDPHNLTTEDDHPGTVYSGIVANLFLAAIHQAYGAGVPLLSDQEILKNAGITPPEGEATFFDVSQAFILESSHPRASFTVAPRSGPEPLEIELDASGSFSLPADSHIVSYEWDFGDGTKGSGEIVNHAYGSFGRYMVRLTVKSTTLVGEEVLEFAGTAVHNVLVDFRSEDTSPWRSMDVGGPFLRGGARFDDGCLLALGPGTGIGGSADQLHFMHQEVTGDMTLTARIAELNAAQVGAKVGVMLREGLDPGSRHVSLVLQKSAGGTSARLLSRVTTNGGSTAKNDGILPLPDAWVRITRKGNEFLCATSIDGSEWKELPPVDMDMPERIHVGIAVTGNESMPGQYAPALAKICEVALETLDVPMFHRGDPNSSGATDISDSLTIFGYLFLGAGAPTCLDSADTNNDGRLDISDGIAILQFLFLGASPPASPGPAPLPCGVDPQATGTAANLGCTSYAPCNAK